MRKEMDPSKPRTAFPPSEKSSMGQAPPPPYYDNPNPGYPQPGPVYPQLPGYVSPTEYGLQPVGQQYPGQPGVIDVQPIAVVTQVPLANPYNDYLGYSIFTMLCCCLPIGVAALVFSIFTREANRTGGQMEAERNSRMAKTLNHVALGAGLGVLLLYIVYILVMTLS